MQYSFRNKTFCTDAIADKTDFIRNVIDKQLTGQACFGDLQKMSITSDHKILLRKWKNLENEENSTI